ncbi:MAG TPA: MarC family protein [Acidimicrobiales bacterium]|nr:MarC family protein [Acidimicrobiales bacterium]
MDFSLDLFARTFVTVLVIMDPIGTVPVFLALTKDQTIDRRKRSALQAVAVAAVVVVLFALFGQELLRLLGISIAALEVSGGLILVLVALELLRPAESGVLATAAGSNVALVPLGTPLLAGPGAIAATMVYIQQAAGSWEIASVIAALLLVHVVLYLAMRFAGGVGRLLGDNGIDLASRLIGLLLAAIAVQLVATGIADWIENGV